MRPDPPADLSPERDWSEGERAALAAYRVPGPPAGFSARIVARLDDPGRRRWPDRPRWRRRALTGVAAAAVACVVAGVAVRGDRWPDAHGGSPAAAGAQRAAARTTLALGARGVAVLEVGAEIAWQVTATGDAVVEQQRGDVFYRVEHGGAFRVHTPLGDGEVTGTSFRVVLSGPEAPSDAALAPTGLAITVYEGRVEMSNALGRTTVTAGATAIAAVGEAPRIAEGDRQRLARIERELALAQARLASLEGQVGVARAAGDYDAIDRRRDPARYYDPRPETRAEMARHCRIAFDRPPLSADGRVELMSPDDAADAGASEAEVRAVNDAYQALNLQNVRKLRALYVEVTGDEAGAQGLSMAAIEQEILEKSAPQDELEARRRISRERAGLDAPPHDLAGRPAVEHYLRMRSGLGDAAEQVLAGVLGAPRARAARVHGWDHNVSDFGECRLRRAE